MHPGDSLFDSELTGFTGISEQKHAVAVTVAKTVTTFRSLPMKVNLNGLTTAAMNINAVHKNIKMNIVHQFN